jgi:outer membrane protein insertion porin family
MRAILALVIAFHVALALATSASGQSSDGSGRVESIVVEGNERIEGETVRSYMTIRVGDRFDPRVVDDSLKTLFATGLFRDVAIDRVGDSLVVRVIENPIINRVAFEGNDAVSDELLEGEVQLQSRMVYTVTRVQSDVQRMLEIYRRSGHFAATVEPKVIQLTQNRVNLVFEIDEGPVTQIERIAFVGNQRFSDAELRSEIQTTESAWWPVAELTQDRGGFFITFALEEGERYRFGKVDLESAIPLDAAEPSEAADEAIARRGPGGVSVEELRTLISTDPGDWYDADEVEASIQAMTDVFGNQGYAFINIEPRVERDSENRVIDVTYDIGEAPRVYVQRIDISGNVRTLDEVIRREFRLAEGDAFNTARYRRSEQRVRNLGFFANVEMEVEPGDAVDQTIITVKVQEQATGQLNFGAGFSTFDGPLVDVGVTESNFLGRGQELRARASISARRLFADIGFTEPYFLGRDIAFGGDLFRRVTDFQTESSFDEEELGASLRGTYSITEWLRHSVRYTIRQDDITDVDANASRFIRDQEGKTLTSSVGQTFSYDQLDNFNSPTEGYSVQLQQDVAGVGGDDRWFRHEFDFQYYYPFAEDWIGRFALLSGYIFGLGEDVDISDRFFVGGTRLRGFDTAGIGPRDIVTDDALGGNAYGVLSFQLSFPLGFPRDFPVRGRVFSDIGTLTEIDESGPELVDKASPRVGVGIGASYLSPFGPVGIDLTQAVVKENFDDTELFRFSFGTRF